MTLVQIAFVLTLVSAGVYIVISARRRSWTELTLAICVMLVPLLRASEFRGSEWVALAVAVVALAAAILLLRERWRDPEWRASWTR
jgi:L-lactate permease